MSIIIDVVLYIHVNTLYIIFVTLYLAFFFMEFNCFSSGVCAKLQKS